MHSNLASSQIATLCLNDSKGGVDQKSNKIGTELSSGEHEPIEMTKLS